jgi:type III secretion system FlhB-like substrate exporter
MEEKSTDEIIKDHYASLPEPVKKAIGSFDWAREIFDIGRSHSLHVDQIGDLQTEVMLVVLGLATPQDFYNQMVGAIAVPNDIAQKIIEEANEKVFNRIADHCLVFFF